MAIEALGHRLTIRPDFKVKDLEAEKTKKKAESLGLVIPDQYQDELEAQINRERASVDQGVVLTIGKTAFRDFGGEPWCDVGDYVAYARHAGKFVKDPDTDEDILVLNDEDIICKITKVIKDE
jgi:co-chaperonin GroES (HSP10)